MDQVLRHYVSVLRQWNTLESQRTDTVYVHSGSGSGAPALRKCTQAVEHSGVTVLRHCVCALRQWIRCSGTA
ncbi:hypothetical protein AMTR_s00089p00152010 [Amborella trichopoda]|uniref:Uncharacterized protein n=1 Tax=Amborella trichopoda TaxID=13333 RepID=W1P4K6_AMBTC|nr:hypothetical protein AMTR_s00089p00152010 [Amborella trichopoda]